MAAKRSSETIVAKSSINSSLDGEPLRSPSWRHSEPLPWEGEQVGEPGLVRQEDGTMPLIVARGWLQAACEGLGKLGMNEVELCFHLPQSD